MIKEIEIEVLQMLRIKQMKLCVEIDGYQELLQINDDVKIQEKLNELVRKYNKLKKIVNERSRNYTKTSY